MGASETHEARTELVEAIDEINSGDLMVMRLSHIDNDGVEMPVEVFRYSLCPPCCVLCHTGYLAVRLARWSVCVA